MNGTGRTITLSRTKREEKNKHLVQPIVFLKIPLLTKHFWEIKTELLLLGMRVVSRYIYQQKELRTIIDSVLDYLLDLIYGTSTCKLHHYS